MDTSDEAACFVELTYRLNKLIPFRSTSLSAIVVVLIVGLGVKGHRKRVEGNN